jgi:hypothetical protein
MMYKIKIVLFSILENFFSLFGLQILFSKKENMDKNLNIKNIIDVGVANGTDFLLKIILKPTIYLLNHIKNFIQT